ncbi:MAG: hypothetical protein V7785_08355 [Bermanella sp.]
MNNSVRVMCTIQENAIQKKSIKELEQILKSIYQGHFGSQCHLNFIWLTMPFGQSFLAGENSTSSTVQIPVADGLAPELRHAFMSEVCTQWQRISGCSKNEIILACPDDSYALRYFEKVDERFKPSLTYFIKMKLLWRLIIGKIKNGYFTASINF